MNIADRSLGATEPATSPRSTCIKRRAKRASRDGGVEECVVPGILLSRARTLLPYRTLEVGPSSTRAIAGASRYDLTAFHMTHCRMPIYPDRARAARPRRESGRRAPHAPRGGAESDKRQLSAPAGRRGQQRSRPVRSAHIIVTSLQCIRTQVFTAAPARATLPMSVIYRATHTSLPRIHTSRSI